MSNMSCMLNNADVVKTGNFMAGVSFKLCALKTLQIVMTSMIAGEPQYYRPASDNGKSDSNKSSNKMIG